MIKYIKDLVCRAGVNRCRENWDSLKQSGPGIVRGRHKEKGIPTHFVELISNREVPVTYLEIDKIEVVRLGKALNNKGYKTTMGGSK